ncbi:hypothetical protein EJ07DRAFT_96209 [Lizonia empirigonia]|nr:hypothetical protein EJ07DRAFT_96209 [Lizonia empirigonia]
MLPPRIKQVSSPDEFIPIHNSGGVPRTSYFVRIEPYSRTVLSVFNSAEPTDFEEYEWLLRYGETEMWYSKPRQCELQKIARCRRLNGEWENKHLGPFQNPRPARLDFPQSWASAALTTPKDDNILDRGLRDSTPKDGAERSASKACTEEKCIGKEAVCNDEKSKALKGTPLAYCLVFTTTHIDEKDYFPHYSGLKSVGEKIFRLFKCGSRQTAIAEAFYTSGVNGWSLAFSCVLRAD